MTHRYMKTGITALVMVLAFGGLLRYTLAEGPEYYKHVDEVMTAPHQWYGRRLQLHGFVVKDSVLRRRESLDYRFKVELARVDEHDFLADRGEVPLDLVLARGRSGVQDLLQ